MSRAPQAPPTCLSLNTLPHSRPIPINSSAAGMETSTVSRIFRLAESPRNRAVTKQIRICATAMGISGSVYPAIKSPDSIGEAKSRIMKELVLSFAMIIPEKSERKDIPNTAIPGVSLSTSNRSTGAFAPIRDKSSSRITGNPIPNPRLVLSLNISLALRDANAIIFMINCLLCRERQTPPQIFPFQPFSSAPLQFQPQKVCPRP